MDPTIGSPGTRWDLQGASGAGHLTVFNWFTNTAPRPWSERFSRQTVTDRETAFYRHRTLAAVDPPYIDAPLPDIRGGTFTARAGQNFSVTLPAIDGGGNAPITYSLSDIPPGLAFDQTTRVLSGQPATPGYFTCTYAASDADDDVSSATVTIRIKTAANSNPTITTGAGRTSNDPFIITNPESITNAALAAFQVAGLRGYYRFNTGTRGGVWALNRHNVGADALRKVAFGDAASTDNTVTVADNTDVNFTIGRSVDYFITLYRPGVIPPAADVSATFGRYHATRGALGFRATAPVEADVSATFARHHQIRGALGFVATVPELSLNDFSDDGRTRDFVALIQVTAGSDTEDQLYATSERGGIQSPIEGNLLFGDDANDDYVTRIVRLGSGYNSLRFNDNFPTSLETWALQTGLRIHLQVLNGTGNDIWFESVDYTDEGAAGGGFVNWRNLPATVTALLAGLSNNQRLIVAATVPTAASDTIETFRRYHEVRGGLGFQARQDRSATFRRFHLMRGALGFRAVGEHVSATFGRHHEVRGALGFFAGQNVSATFGRNHLVRGSLGFKAVGGHVSTTFGRHHAVRGSLGFLAGQPVSATFARHHLIRGALGFVATPQISFASWTTPSGRSDPILLVLVQAANGTSDPVDFYSTSQGQLLDTGNPLFDQAIAGSSTLGLVRWERGGTMLTLLHNGYVGNYGTDVTSGDLATGQIHVVTDDGTAVIPMANPDGSGASWARHDTTTAVRAIINTITPGQRFLVAVTLPSDNVSGTFGRYHQIRGALGFVATGADVSTTFGRRHEVRGALGFRAAGSHVSATFGRYHEARGALGFRVIGAPVSATFGRHHEVRGALGFAVQGTNVSTTFGRRHEVRGALGFVATGGAVSATFGRRHEVRGALGFLASGGTVVGTFGRFHEVRGALGFVAVPTGAAGGDGVRIDVAGAEFPGVLFGTVSITRGVNRRAVLSATWRGRLPTLSRHPREGDLVEVIDRRTGRVIFGGHLNAPRLRVLPGNAMGDINLDSVGYYARLEQVQLDQERAIDVVEATTPADQVALIVGALAGEGFRADVDVSGFATIEEDIRFRSLRDAVALLVELHGASVTVDTTRVVYFRDRDRAPDSGVTLDASNVERFTVERDRQHIRTSQRLIGGEVPTSESFTGDGATDSWRLGGMTDVATPFGNGALVPGHPGPGTTPGLLWQHAVTGLAPADHGSLRRAVIVAGAADGGDPINPAYTGVPGYVAWLALTWDPSDTTKDMTVQVNLHDQNTGSPIDFWDDSVEPGFGDPQFPNATVGCIVKHRKTAIGANAGNIITHDAPGYEYLQRVPPVYVDVTEDTFINRWRMRKARSDTDGDISFRMSHVTSGSGGGLGPNLTDEALANIVVYVRIRSTGEIRSWALADQVAADADMDTTEPYSWGTPDPPYGGSWARAIDDNEVDILFIDKRYADLTNQMFTTATGGQAGPNLAGVHDIGLVIVGGDTFRLPLDVLPAGAQEPYTWTIPYDADLVSAMTGDVCVSLVDRSSPAVRWAQSAIVTERTRLSVVSITGVTEGGTDATLGEDYTFDTARQRLTRVAGALGSGGVLTAHYIADRVIEDAVASDRAVHVTEHAEFDTASIGAERARAALDLYAQPALIIRAAMRTGHDRHIGEGELVTLPAAQLRLMGIPGVTGDEQWLVDEVQIRGIGDLLSYTLRLVRGSASSSFVEFWRRRLSA